MIWKCIPTRFYWQWLLVLLILVGISFRVVGLGQRVYWVDEVATSIRIAGYTKAQLTALLSDGAALYPAHLQQFLHLSAQTPWSHTLSALAQSPEHTPLYFLLARGWVQLWGSSVVAMRSLSVLFSLMALVLMGGLAYQLYASAKAAAIAVVLLALSPFFVSYAQEARPYSLWSVTLLLSGLMLLGAMQRPTRGRWIGYGLSVALGLYTSLLTLLVVLGQGLYVLSVGNRRCRRGFGLALGVATLSFVPWLGVMMAHWELLQGNTEWMRQPMGGLSLLMIWLYSVSVLLFDVPATISFDLATGSKILTSIAVLAGMGLALVCLYQRTPPHVWQFVFLFTFSIPIALVGWDLLTQGQLSTAARYLVPFHLGMILAIAFYLLHLLNSPKPEQRSLGRGITVGIIFLCCLSYSFQLQQPSKYHKSRNLHNQPIAALINQATAPLILAEPDQTMDLLSLSFDLQPDVQIQLSSSVELKLQSSSRHVLFLFNPSQALKDRIQTTHPGQIEQVYHPQRLIPDEIALSLWQVHQNDPSTHHSTKTKTSNSSSQSR